MKKIEDYQKQMNPCYKDYDAFYTREYEKLLKQLESE